MQNEGNALPLQQGLPPQEGCTNSTTQSVSRASLHDFQPQPMKFQPQFQIYPSSTQNYLPQPQNWGQGYVNPPQHSYTQHEYSTPQKFEGQQPFNEQNAFGPPPPYTPLAQNFQPQTAVNDVVVQQHVQVATVRRPRNDYYLTLSLVMVVLCCFFGGWWNLICVFSAVAVANAARSDAAAGNMTSASRKSWIVLCLNMFSIILYIAGVIIIVTLTIIILTAY